MTLSPYVKWLNLPEFHFVVELITTLDTSFNFRILPVDGGFFVVKTNHDISVNFCGMSLVFLSENHLRAQCRCFAGECLKFIANFCI